MPDKKKKPTVKSLPTKKLSDKEAASVKGGMGISGGGLTGGGTKKIASDSCKETTDTGMMGCAG